MFCFWFLTFVYCCPGPFIVRASSNEFPCKTTFVPKQSKSILPEKKPQCMGYNAAMASLALALIDPR